MPLRQISRLIPLTFFALLILAALVCQVGAATQTKSPNDQRDRLAKVFAAAIEACGGENAISQIKSIEAFAKCNGPNGAYTTDIQSFRKNKTRFQQVFPDRKEATDVFINGNIGWQSNGMNEPPSVIPPFQLLVVRLHEYQRMAIDFQTMFKEFEFIGEATFNGKPGIKVNAKTEIGMPIHLFFDGDSKLLAGYILPAGGELITNVFDEWKLVKGVKLPSVVTATDRSGDFVLRFDRITINQADEKSLDVPARIADHTELMRLQKQAEKAHLTYDAALLVEQFSDQGITEISGGTVSKLTNQEGLKRFKSYFESVKFLEWADTAPPDIRLSDDGTMATITVQKRVRFVPKADKSESNQQQFEFAWLEVWQKFNGTWKLTSLASTDRKRKVQSENKTLPKNDIPDR